MWVLKYTPAHYEPLKFQFWSTNVTQVQEISILILIDGLSRLHCLKNGGNISDKNNVAQ